MRRPAGLSRSLKRGPVPNPHREEESERKRLRPGTVANDPAVTARRSALRMLPGSSRACLRPDAPRAALTWSPRRSPAPAPARASLHTSRRAEQGGPGLGQPRRRSHIARRPAARLGERGQGAPRPRRRRRRSGAPSTLSPRQSHRRRRRCRLVTWPPPPLTGPPPPAASARRPVTGLGSFT